MAEPGAARAVAASRRPAALVTVLVVTLAVYALGSIIAMDIEPRVGQRGRDVSLIDAAARGNLGESSRLLADGASVKATDSRGRTALIAAAYGKHNEVAQLLIRAGADVNFQDDTRQSAYLIPSADGNVELLRLTLAAGADVTSLDSYNGTGLIRAADRGHVEVVRELLETPIDVDHVNRLGWTALLEAVILGDGGPRQSEVVRLLLEAGADPSLADSNGTTPLQHSRRRGFEDMTSLIERAGGR